MNEERRKRLIEISIKLDDLLDDLEEVIEEEEEAFNNLPESLPEGIVIMSYHTYNKTQRRKEDVQTDWIPSKERQLSEKGHRGTGGVRQNRALPCHGRKRGRQRVYAGNSERTKRYIQNHRCKDAGRGNQQRSIRNHRPDREAGRERQNAAERSKTGGGVI